MRELIIYNFICRLCRAIQISAEWLIPDLNVLEIINENYLVVKGAIVSAKRYLGTGLRSIVNASMGVRVDSVGLRGCD